MDRRSDFETTQHLEALMPELRDALAKNFVTQSAQDENSEKLLR